MRRVGLILFSGLLFGLFTSCESDSSMNLGSNFINSSANVIYTDTLSVKFSTYINDTVITSGHNIALVGKFANSQIGGVRTQSYIPLSADDQSLITENSTFDSLVLVLKPSGYYYGDTTSIYHLYVNKVDSIIQPKPTEYDMYNSSYVKHDSTKILGSKSFYPRPKAKEEIRIRLSNSLGLGIFNLYKSGSDSIRELGGFPYYFNGILLRGDKDNKVILGYSTSSIKLNLYFRTDNLTEKDTLTEFPAYQGSSFLQYNQIMLSRGKAIEIVRSDSTTTSDSLDNLSYAQGGVGLTTRIDFPSIKEYLNQFYPYKIVKAELYIQPSVDMDYDYLPSSLYLYATNKHNESLGQISNDSQTALKGSLYTDYIIKENTRYVWDITTYLVKGMIDSNFKTYNGLLLKPDNYGSSFDQVIIADQLKSHNRTHLKLYILRYE